MIDQEVSDVCHYLELELSPLNPSSDDETVSWILNEQNNSSSSPTFPSAHKAPAASLLSGFRLAAKANFNFPRCRGTLTAEKTVKKQAPVFFSGL